MKRRDCIAWGFGTALAGRALAQDEQPKQPLPIDWPTLTLLDGATLEPAAWQGQYSVLVFWATWCPFCKRHNAHLDKLYRSVRGQPLRVLGISVERDPALVRRYMESNGYAFPVALDTVGLRERLTARKSIPMTCIIDRQGRLVQAMPGEMFEEDVLAFARLAKKDAA